MKEEKIQRFGVQQQNNSTYCLKNTKPNENVCGFGPTKDSYTILHNTHIYYL